MSAPEPCYVRKAQFVAPVDGDSFYVRLDHGSFPNTRSEDTIEVRVLDLWCPELDEPGGPEAADFTTSVMRQAAKIVVQTFRTKGDKGKGSFARTIGDVWVDDERLADVVVGAHHGHRTRDGRDAAVRAARAAQGEGRPPWTNGVA